MNFIPKFDARVELDATERATLKSTSEILNKLFVYFYKVNDSVNGEILIGDWGFNPDNDCFSIYEIVDILDDLSNEELPITIR